MIRTTALSLAMVALCTATVRADHVFLDFDTGTDGAIVYTPSMRTQVRDLMAGHYSAFNTTFSITPPVSGDFSTIFFNAGGPGGLASQIDFRNVDLNDTAVVNVDGFGFVTEADIVSSSAVIGSHELGHIKGLRHGNAWGPPGTGITNPPGTGSMLPAYPGPVGASESTDHIMASPASVGSSLGDTLTPSWFSERSATKLAFNETPNVTNEQGLPHSTPGTAQAVNQVPLAVPNTIASGANAGLPLVADAWSVTGAILTSGEMDYYSFNANAGDIYSFELMSQTLDRLFPNQIDGFITVFGPDGVTPVNYYGTPAQNEDEFESFDAWIIDLILPEDGTYFVNVQSSPSFDPNGTGDYELYGYSISVVPAPTGGAMLASLALVVSGYRLRRRRRA